MMYRTYTRKQAGVIYRCMKQGLITVEKDVMAKIYDMADEPAECFHDGYDMHKTVIAIVDKLFAEEYEFAQGLINEIAA